jgi:hypothetical protein
VRVEGVRDSQVVGHEIGEVVSFGVAFWGGACCCDVRAAEGC